MRKVLRKIIQILDGTPAVYGSPARGQSVVELVLVTPILIILIMGLVEIGWFANNFLILLESSRVGARFGTIQTGDTSPLAWPNQYSVSPNAFPAYYGYTGDPGPDVYQDALRYRRCSEVRDFQELQGFYNLISCVMLQSITPLEFRSPIDDPAGADTEANGVDDIVISAFSLQTLKLSDIPTDDNMRNDTVNSLVPTIPATQQQVIVVGRYPINANECSVKADGTFQNPPYERDPFDYIRNNDSEFDYILADLAQPDELSNRLYLELSVGTDPTTGAPVFGYDNNVAGNAATWERQIGFSLTGQHYISTRPQCVGSEWSIADVQELMNLPQFGLSVDPLKASERERLPSQGIVLVEMFWEHELLLKNPVFNPVFTVIGTERTTVSVWSVFPVPAVEPRIKYR